MKNNLILPFFLFLFSFSLAQVNNTDDANTHDSIDGVFNSGEEITGAILYTRERGAGFLDGIFTSFFGYDITAGTLITFVALSVIASAIIGFIYLNIKPLLILAIIVFVGWLLLPIVLGWLGI